MLPGTGGGGEGGEPRTSHASGTRRRRRRAGCDRRGGARRRASRRRGHERVGRQRSGPPPVGGPGPGPFHSGRNADPAPLRRVAPHHFLLPLRVFKTVSTVLPLIQSGRRPPVVPGGTTW